MKVVSKRKISDGLMVEIYADKRSASSRVASLGGEIVRQAIQERGHATIVVPTGASQFDMIDSFIVQPGIDWTKVTGFHLDEYVGLPITHPASFRKYLWERFVSRLPLPLAAFHYVNGEADPQKECARLAALIQKHEVDLCFAGIGENGHLAFNDPPADFETTQPYLVVDLDEGCRRQQLGEGWFSDLQAVPVKAISMSARQILKSRHILCAIPDRRKAVAVRDCLLGPVDVSHPASILQMHPNALCCLDAEAASLL
jgi:glucosamine-6-phosphate deaminase